MLFQVQYITGFLHFLLSLAARNFLLGGIVNFHSLEIAGVST